jgi:hypothetical protein
MKRDKKHTFGILKGNRRSFSHDDDMFLRILNNPRRRITWQEISSSMPGFKPR